MRQYDRLSQRKVGFLKQYIISHTGLGCVLSYLFTTNRSLFLRGNTHGRPGCSFTAAAADADVPTAGTCFHAVESTAALHAATTNASRRRCEA